MLNFHVARHATRIALTLATAAAVLVGGSLAATAAPVPAGKYIVVLRDGTDASAAAQRHDSLDGAQISDVYSAALDGFAAVLPASAVTALNADPQVESVTPVGTFRTPAGAVAAVPCAVAGDMTACQVLGGGLSRIGGAESSTLSGDGSGSVDANVAVIDTGIDATHPDLLVAGGVNCVPDGLGVGVDPYGHGTMVAGIIGARDDGAYSVGVAPGVRLWSVRVLDSTGAGDGAWVLCGIDWVTATRTDDDPTNDIDVVNMSLGGPGADDNDCGYTNADPIHQAVCRAVDAGVVFSVAAGNGASDLAGVSPAAYDEVLTVTAMADSDGRPGAVGPPDACAGFADDALAPFSSFSTAADAPHVVAAPGVCIASDYPGGTMMSGSGTSFAAPFVTGAVALCLASGVCSAEEPVVARIVQDALNYSTANPQFGFAGDPLRPVGGLAYGPLLSVSGY